MSALSAGMTGRALRRLTQTGTLPSSPETLETLRKLHPHYPNPALCESSVTPPFSVKLDGPAIRAMKHSAPGPSGLRSDHLLLAYPSGISDSIISILNLIANGMAPQWLANARLFAIPKIAGGVRPIAVGETLRRVAAAVLLRTVMPQLPVLV